MAAVEGSVVTVEDASADMLSEWSVIPDSSNALRAEAALEREATVVDAVDFKAVLSVVAPPVAETARVPLRLVAVLDRSGSMRGEKLRLVRQTMLFMLRHLSERDALGIVEYDTEVKVAAPLTFCNASGRNRLEAALKRLRAGTQTNLSGGLLKGLRVHCDAAQDAAPAPSSQPSLQRVSIGNTYRRLSEEEAVESETRPGVMQEHEWTMAVRFEAPEDAALVQKVVYKLHETFRNPVVEVLEAPFELTRKGWGTFNVVADIHLRDGRVLTLDHVLRFDQPETFRTELLQLRSSPVGLDYYVNGVKMVRVTSLDFLEQAASSSGYPEAQGRTLRLDGISYGAWKAKRRTTVPGGRADVCERVMELFKAKGTMPGRVEFTDTDGDKIAFVAEAAVPAEPAAEAATVAAAVAAEGIEKAVVRSTFLFTDGLANVGITKVDDLVQAAQAALGELGDSRCTVSTFGFGKDHNADLLQGLAEVGAGIYSYIEDEDKIGESFGEALGGLLSTTHQNVTLALELAPGVGWSKAFTSYSVEGPSKSASCATVVRIDVGDLFAEERRDILVSLALPAAAAEGPQVLGQLEVQGFAVLAKRTETAAPVTLSVQRRAGADVEAPCHPQVERHRLRHTATEALEAGRAAAHRGDLAAARKLLATACEALSASPLTVGGDSACLGLLADLKECIADLRHEESYRSCGSKKMACMQGAHTKQRACFGQDFTVTYSNATMGSMRAAFKANCK